MKSLYKDLSIKSAQKRANMITRNKELTNNNIKNKNLKTLLTQWKWIWKCENKRNCVIQTFSFVVGFWRCRGKNMFWFLYIYKFIYWKTETRILCCLFFYNKKLIWKKYQQQQQKPTWQQKCLVCVLSFQSVVSFVFVLIAQYRKIVSALCSEWLQYFWYSNCLESILRASSQMFSIIAVPIN